MEYGEDWKRRRAKEVEREEEEESTLKKKLAEETPVKNGLSSDRVDDLIHRADLLIEQLNNLYAMYVAGAEKLPPTEKRKQLEQITATLIFTGKPTPAILFRCNSLISKYNTYKERWERMIKDLESGRVKRRAA